MANLSKDNFGLWARGDDGVARPVEQAFMADGSEGLLTTDGEKL